MTIQQRSSGETAGFIRASVPWNGVASQFGRVVKALDLKSNGVTRAGSNPAADVSFATFCNLERKKNEAYGVRVQVYV